MGGQIALNFALNRKPAVAGVLVTAPWLRLAFTPPAWKVRLGTLIGSVWPSFALASGLEGGQPMAHDTAHLNGLPEGELNHTKISARLGADAIAHGAEALARAAEFNYPLLLHGSDDQVIDPQASREFYAAAGSADKTLKLYPGLFHEIHNELPERRGEVLADMIAWLDARA